MTTDEANEGDLFTVLVEHRDLGIDPKYVSTDAVANIADACTEWRSELQRATVENALGGQSTEAGSLGRQGLKTEELLCRRTEA